MRFLDKFSAPNRLYHYTKFESSMKILASKKIRFGKMNRMNDPDESLRLVMTDPSLTEDRCSLVRKELQKYQQISFTSDSCSKPGFLIGTMWGHYANSGYGVCLVFNKDVIDAQLQGTEPYHVDYVDNYDPSIMFSGIEDYSPKGITEYTEKHKKEIFFKKSSDWEKEQEYRIVRRFEQPTDDTGDEYLDLSSCWDKCLLAVIINLVDGVPSTGYNCDSAMYKALAKVVGCPILQLCKDFEGRDALLEIDSSIKRIWGSPTYWGYYCDWNNIDMSQIINYDYREN